MTDDNKSDILRLSDLLELFQGPVPIKDRMVIATTNRYEDIKNIIPALFRAGRLTEMEFGYIDWGSFCELCRYYFSKDPTIDKVDINIPTSQITELVTKYILNKDFDGFIYDVLEQINKKNSINSINSINKD